MNNLIGYPNPNAIRPNYPTPADIVPLPYYPTPGGEQPMPLPFPNDQFQPSEPSLKDFLNPRKHLDEGKKSGKSRRGKKTGFNREKALKRIQIEKLKSEIESLKSDLERRRLNADNQTNEYAKLHRLEAELASLEGRPAPYEVRDKDLLFNGGGLGMKHLNQINQPALSTMELRM